MAARAGARGPAAVRALLAEHDCHCPLSAVESWLDGSADPSATRMRLIIVALSSALDGVDVWDDYERSVVGGELTTRESTRPADLGEASSRSRLLPPPL